MKSDLEDMQVALRDRSLFMAGGGGGSGSKVGGGHRKYFECLRVGIEKILIIPGRRKIGVRSRVDCEIFPSRDEWYLVKSHLNPIPLAINNDRSLISYCNCGLPNR